MSRREFRSQAPVCFTLNSTENGDLTRFFLQAEWTCFPFSLHYHYSLHVRPSEVLFLRARVFFSAVGEGMTFK